jgi:hypothetical protein
MRWLAEIINNILLSIVWRMMYKNSTINNFFLDKIADVVIYLEDYLYPMDRKTFPTGTEEWYD